jgi:hypothetical protein
MKWIPIDPRAWGGIAIFLMVLHVWFAVITRDNLWLARCGALWVIIGALVIARPIIRRGGYAHWYESTKHIDYGTLGPPNAEEAEAERQTELDARCVQLTGPSIALLGTLLWAYGDLGADAISRVAVRFGASN